MADYTAWYRVGTVALTLNSKIVTGTGTYWLAANIKPGDMFSTDCVTEYEVASVDSNTQITLRTPYLGTTTTDTAYRIIRNFTSTMGAETAAMTAGLLNDFRRFVDLQMQSIHGKSAYQLACDHGYAGTESAWLESLTAYGVAKSNGYTGTLAQWLESLKAAGEWSKLDTRTEGMTFNAAVTKNLFYWGQNLGAFTSTHLAAIKAGTFEGLCLGDYFTHDGKIDRIAQFNGKSIYLHRQTHFKDDTKFVDAFNRWPSGTEGADDYDPGTKGKYYAESNWYQAIRPYFIEEIESIYGAANCKSFRIDVPTGMNGQVPTGWISLTSKAHLLTMGMMGYEQKYLDNSNWYRQTMCRPKQLALARIAPWAIPAFCVLADGRFEGPEFCKLTSTCGANPINVIDLTWSNRPAGVDGTGNSQRICPVFIVG